MKCSFGVGEKVVLWGKKSKIGLRKQPKGANIEAVDTRGGSPIHAFREA